MAVNVTLLHLLLSAVLQCQHLLSIDISCLRGAQQHTHHLPLLWSMDGTDRQMDITR